ncbi:MAG: hypothetical protein ACI9XO_003496 [Paraglaciecola sp.]|jgi:hypothetical protein
MKKVLCSLVFLFFSTAILFGQGKIAEKAYQHFEPDNGGWVSDSRENWAYDAADREVAHTTWSSYQGAFAPYNNTRIESVYRPNGQLVFQENRSWGDTIWTATETTYQYDVGDELREVIYKNEDSEYEIISYQKLVYETDLDAKRRTQQFYYSLDAPENWLIQYQRDNLFNENDCLVKEVILNYDELGEQTNERWTVSDVNENCQIQTSSYWLDNASTDSIFLYTRHNYSYSNDDKTQTDIYERRIQQSEEWQTQHLVEKTVNEAGQEVRYFYENYKTNYTDTVLKLSTYTLQGELETFREFKTAYQVNDNPLYIVRLDSLTYQYDDEGKLLRKDQFIQSYSNPIRHFTTRYDYYCNGQLKTETTENLPNISRIHYEYYGNPDCLLLKNESSTLVVFPNPSDGNFTIQSNLLATAEAKLELYSVVGQLIFTKKIDRIAPAFNLEFPELSKGQYILTLRNAKETVSEKVLIQ